MVIKRVNRMSEANKISEAEPKRPTTDMPEPDAPEVPQVPKVQVPQGPQIVGRITINVFEGGEFVHTVESVYPYAVPTMLETVAERVKDELVHSKRR